MSRAFVVFILVLLLSPLALLSDYPVAERQSGSDASYSFSTPGAAQFGYDFWRWGKLSPQWRDTYEVLLEAEMIAVSEDFDGSIAANRHLGTVC